MITEDYITELHCMTDDFCKYSTQSVIRGRLGIRRWFGIAIVNPVF